MPQSTELAPLVPHDRLWPPLADRDFTLELRAFVREQVVPEADAIDEGGFQKQRMPEIAADPLRSILMPNVSEEVSEADTEAEIMNPANQIRRSHAMNNSDPHRSADFDQLPAF